MTMRVKNFHMNKKIILWILIIVLLLALTYFSLKKERIFGFSFGPGFNLLKNNNQDIESFKKSAAEKGKEITNSFKNLLDLNEEITGFKKGIAENLDKTLGQTIFNAKGTIYEAIEGSLNKTGNIIGEFLGIDSDSAVNSAIINDADSFAKFFTYLIKIDAPVSFIIKNPFNNEIEIEYQMDWGDEKKDSGKLSSNQNIVISHAWNKEGEYLIKIKIIASVQVFNFQTKVSVAK